MVDLFIPPDLRTDCLWIYAIDLEAAIATNQ